MSCVVLQHKHHLLCRREIGHPTSVIGVVDVEADLPLVGHFDVGRHFELGFDVEADAVLGPAQVNEAQEGYVNAV